MKLACITFAVLVILSGCSDEQILIGAPLILSGVGSNFGEDAQRGISLALEDISIQYPKLSFKIIYEDNHGNNPASAVQGYRALRTRGVELFIGPNWVTSALAIAPIACADEVVMIAPSVGNKDFSGACDNLFDLWANDDDLSEAIVQKLMANNVTRIAIIGSQDSWELQQAQNVRAAFEKRGGLVTSYQITAYEERNFMNEGTHILASDVDAVVFTNYGSQGLSAKRFRSLGIIAPFYSVILDNAQIASADGAFEGTIVANSNTPSSAFVQKYVAAYGEEPDINADTAYDALMLLAQAINATGTSDANAVRAYLQTVHSYSGMSGDLTFTARGNIEKPIVLQQIIDGELVVLS